MIKTVVCDRCRKEIPSEDATRMGAVQTNSVGLVHIPGYDGEFGDTFAYIDLCPICSQKFNAWMKGEEAK